MMDAILHIIQRQISNGWDALQDIISVPKRQRRLIMVIVCVALLLDNMLYMVIVSIDHCLNSVTYSISQVPIIPDYLQSIGAWSTTASNISKAIPINDKISKLTTIATATSTNNKNDDDNSEDVAVGTLFGSKAIIQLLVNPFSGALIDRIGYDIPMCIGLCVIFLSTTTFAFGRSYGVLFVARSLQGVGSAFADTSGLGRF